MEILQIEYIMVYPIYHNMYIPFGKHIKKKTMEHHPLVLVLDLEDQSAMYVYICMRMYTSIHIHIHIYDIIWYTVMYYDVR